VWGFRCYRLHDLLDGNPVRDLDAYIEPAAEPMNGGHMRQEFGPVTGSGFTAKLYTSVGRINSPSWNDFLEPAFGPLGLPSVQSLGATLVVRLESAKHFAFTFGATGRHLLRDDAWCRAYGTRASLNLVFGPGADPASLLAVRTKRRGSQTLRTASQSSGTTTLETFGLDLLRDVLGGFTAVPLERDTWGPRITGTDSLAFESDRGFDQLADLCHDVDSAAAREDYRAVLPWLQDVQPVSEPEDLARLQEHVIDMIRRRDTEHLDLAPPEIVDWEHVIGFRLPGDRWERGSKGRRSELRLIDILRRLEETGELRSIDVNTLKRRRVSIVDEDGNSRPRWSLWRCLVAHFEVKGTTYVLDEGDFFAIDRDFLADLDRHVDSLSTEYSLLIPATAGDTEADYFSKFSDNARAAVIHNRRIKPRKWTTEVEVCDILTDDRKLIHIKRHLGARDLSHLFSQGSVSAQLLQEEEGFRIAAAEVAEEVSDGRWTFFLVDQIPPFAFEIVYGIIADWRERSLSEALPLFSKVNLRSFVQQLRGRHFRVGCCQIPVVGSD
jgi:uncharacterized protein (TIGR04141 family)